VIGPRDNGLPGPAVALRVNAAVVLHAQFPILFPQEFSTEGPKIIIIIIIIERGAVSVRQPLSLFLVFSTLEVFLNEMRSINPRFTYLLTSVVCQQERQFGVLVDVVTIIRSHVHVRLSGRRSHAMRKYAELCSATTRQHAAQLLMQSNQIKSKQIYFYRATLCVARS